MFNYISGCLRKGFIRYRKSEAFTEDGRLPEKLSESRYSIAREALSLVVVYVVLKGKSSLLTYTNQTRQVADVLGTKKRHAEIGFTVEQARIFTIFGMGLKVGAVTAIKSLVEDTTTGAYEYAKNGNRIMRRLEIGRLQTDTLVDSSWIVPITTAITNLVIAAGLLINKIAGILLGTFYLRHTVRLNVWSNGRKMNDAPFLSRISGLVSKLAGLTNLRFQVRAEPFGAFFNFT